MNQAASASLIELLQEPIRLVKKTSEISKNKKSMMKRFKEMFLPWQSRSYFTFRRMEVNQKVKILDVDIPSMLSKIPEIREYDELNMKCVSLDWQPYISSNMSGQTTVLLCDFRSLLVKNIVKGGYTFPTSRRVSDLAISPGYLVNLRDPNLQNVFKFIILSAGLDLVTDSYYGRITLTFEFRLGNSKKMAIKDSDTLTLVSSSDATLIYQNEMGPMPEITEGIDIEDIIHSFERSSSGSDPDEKDLQDSRSNVRAFTDLDDFNKTLKKTFSSEDKIPSVTKDKCKSPLECGHSSHFVPVSKLNTFALNSRKSISHPPTQSNPIDRPQNILQRCSSFVDHHKRDSTSEIEIQGFHSDVETILNGCQVAGSSSKSTQQVVELNPNAPAGKYIYRTLE